MCTGALLTTVGLSYADNLADTQTILDANLVVPYDGHLMVGDEVASGTKDIKFDLYEIEMGGVPVWTETQTVAFYNGRFSAGLGSVEPLTDTLLDAEKLWLAMTIIDTDQTGATVEVALAGRQAIEPAPFAVWAGNSADMQVEGTMTAGVRMDIDGATLEFGSSNATALFENASNELYFAPGQVYSGVFIGNDVTMNYTGTVVGTFSTQGANNLGDSTDDDTTVSGDFTIQVNSTLIGTMSTQGDVTLGNGSGDTTTVTGSLRANQNIVLADDKDIIGVDLIQGFNDLRLRGSSSQNDADIDIESDGRVRIDGNLTVSGDITNFNALFTEDDTTRTNSEGTTQNTILSTTDRVCFLTRVEINGMDGDGQRVRCDVNTSGSNWRLTTQTESNQVEAICGARCFNW